MNCSIFICESSFVPVFAIGIRVCDFELFSFTFLSIVIDKVDEENYSLC